MRRRQQFYQCPEGRRLALQECTNLNLDFRRILGIWQTCQEACEVAEEDEMKDEPFKFVIQVLNNACPVSVEQGH